MAYTPEDQEADLQRVIDRLDAGDTADLIRLVLFEEGMADSDEGEVPFDHHQKTELADLVLEMIKEDYGDTDEEGTPWTVGRWDHHPDRSSQHRRDEVAKARSRANERSRGLGRGGRKPS